MNNLVYKIARRPDIGYVLLEDYSINMWGSEFVLHAGDVILDKKENNPPGVNHKVLRPYEFIAMLKTSHSGYGLAISVTKVVREKDEKNNKA